MVTLAALNWQAIGSLRNKILCYRGCHVCKVDLENCNGERCERLTRSKFEFITSHIGRWYYKIPKDRSSIRMDWDKAGTEPGYCWDKAGT